MHNRKRGYCSQQQDDNAKMKHKHTHAHTHQPVEIRFAFAFISFSVFGSGSSKFFGTWECLLVFLLTLIFNSATLLHLLFVISFKCRPIFTWRIRNGKVILPMNKMLNEGAFLSVRVYPQNLFAGGREPKHIHFFILFGHGLKSSKLVVSCWID